MAYTREIEKLKRQWDENPKGTSFAPLAELYRKDGQHEKAMDVLRVGLESNPKHIPGNIVLGRCCLDLKQDAEAEVAFSRALELDPENVIALKALAEITERAGRLDEATIWLQQLVAVDPSNDDARDQLNRVTIAQQAPEPEPVPEPVAEIVEPPPAPAYEPPAEPSPLAMDEPFTIEARPPAPFSAPPAFAPPPLESPAPTIDPFRPPVEPAAAESSSPPALAGFESSEFDARAAADVSAQGVPGMVFDQPAGPAAHGAGGREEKHEFGLEKAEEIVLRVSETTEFQTASASEDMATNFRVGQSSEYQTASASEDFAAKFVEPAPPAAAPPPEPPAPVAEEVTPRVSEEFSPHLGVEQWSPPPAAPAPEPEIAAFPPDPQFFKLTPDPVPESLNFAASEPEPTLAPEPVVEAAVEEAATASSIPETPAPEPVAPPAASAAGLKIIYPPTPAASENEEPSVGGEPEPVLTETMAELYQRQGLRHEALRVYKALSDRAPGDLHLRERVAQLEADLAQHTANRRAATSLTASATGGESVGALFQGLLGTSVGSSATQPARSASSVEAPEPTRGGAPTRPAQDSLSLSAIFGEDSSPVPPTVGAGESSPGVPAGMSSGGVSFDQFFGDQPGAADGSGPGRRPSRAGGTDEDLDQFQNWLKSLKR
ncbi:MAG TPA: tetratricopeptide repeat protein [Gemmatimonadales bacterium]|nr:tetratricopeptide repeat protein [Gemmatimonadales bacterium]